MLAIQPMFCFDARNMPFTTKKNIIPKLNQIPYEVNDFAITMLILQFQVFGAQVKIVSDEMIICPF